MLAASVAAVVMVAVYCVLAARTVEGVNVAAFPLTPTVPVAAFNGETASTVGGVVSGIGAVVNFHA